MKRKVLLAGIIIMTLELTGFSQLKNQVLYKQLDSIDLYMDIFYPQNYDAQTTYPAILFFFGGGWNGGSISQFEPQAKYFSERGMVCFLADYRVNSRQQTTPFESLKDAKSAMRFVRKNAADFHINPDKIVASGGSAGGHLAAATALIDKFNEDSDDLSVSAVPNALVLFNPVIDNGPGGYGYDRIADEYKDFSPLHNIVEGAPPTIFFLGTKDKLIPVETAEYYKVVMEKVGSRCDLLLFEGEPHGFFNYKNLDNFERTTFQADTFLISIGYLSGNPLLRFE